MVSEEPTEERSATGQGHEPANWPSEWSDSPGSTSESGATTSSKQIADGTLKTGRFELEQQKRQSDLTRQCICDGDCRPASPSPIHFQWQRSAPQTASRKGSPSRMPAIGALNSRLDCLGLKPTAVAAGLQIPRGGRVLSTIQVAQASKSGVRVSTTPPQQGHGQAGHRLLTSFQFLILMRNRCSE